MFLLLRRFSKFALQVLSFVILSPLYLIAVAKIALAAVVCGAVCGGVVYFVVEFVNGGFDLTLPAELIAVLWGAAVAPLTLAQGLYAAVRRGEWPQ